MHPRMYMQTVQFVTFDRYTKSFTFETRHISRRRYHFIITKSQFLALDDVIMLIDEGLKHGYYPLDTKHVAVLQSEQCCSIQGNDRV